jgi:hypothetical protein
VKSIHPRWNQFAQGRCQSGGGVAPRAEFVQAVAHVLVPLEFVQAVRTPDQHRMHTGCTPPDGRRMDAASAPDEHRMNGVNLLI